MKATNLVDDVNKNIDKLQELLNNDANANTEIVPNRDVKDGKLVEHDDLTKSAPDKSEKEIDDKDAEVDDKEEEKKEKHEKELDDKDAKKDDKEEEKKDEVAKSSAKVEAVDNDADNNIVDTATDVSVSDDTKKKHDDTDKAKDKKDVKKSLETDAPQADANGIGFTGVEFDKYMKSFTDTVVQILQVREEQRHQDSVNLVNAITALNNSIVSNGHKGLVEEAPLIHADNHEAELTKDEPVKKSVEQPEEPVVASEEPETVEPEVAPEEPVAETAETSEVAEEEPVEKSFPVGKAVSSAEEEPEDNTITKSALTSAINSSIASLSKSLYGDESSRIQRLVNLRKSLASFDDDDAIDKKYVDAYENI